jgi:23S rRNA (uracil1939-C5)-methyltransferase
MDELFELELIANIYGGDCVGRLPDGKAIFVPFGIAGETVQIQITENRKNFSRGKIVKIISPSPNRIQPRCLHYSICGGCHYQHLPYSSQLTIKQGIVIDQLTRIGKFVAPPVKHIIPSPQEWNYRNIVQFHMSPTGRVGYQSSGGINVIEIKECHLPVPAINETWPLLEIDPVSGINRVSLRCGSDQELLIGMEGSSQSAPDFSVDFPISVVFQGPDETILLSGNDYTSMTIKGRNFIVSAGSFFQVNIPQAEEMVDYVLDNLLINHESTVVDAYCGVGLFSAFIAPKVKDLVSIELSESACNDFATNLDEYDNVSLYIGAVEEVLPGLDIHPQVILLDPPRAGLEKGALSGIVNAKPEQIIYVSCDPSTLARDARLIVESGYHLTSVTPFDLFPQTFHIETISIFKRI